MYGLTSIRPLDPPGRLLPLEAYRRHSRSVSRHLLRYRLRADRHMASGNPTLQVPATLAWSSITVIQYQQTLSQDGMLDKIGTFPQPHKTRLSALDMSPQSPTRILRLSEGNQKEAPSASTPASHLSPDHLHRGPTLRQRGICLPL